MIEVVGVSRRDHISPVLHDVLHCLPVTQRIQFKIAAAAFDCVCGIGPAYFKDVCTTVVKQGRFPTFDATRIPFSRSNGQRSWLEVGGVIQCRPNLVARLLVIMSLNTLL